jgi:hypothetical protein
LISTFARRTTCVALVVHQCSVPANSRELIIGVSKKKIHKNMVAKGVIVRLNKRINRKQKMKTKEKRKVTRLGAALRALGGLGGSAVGGLVGHPQIGSMLGTNLGATISRWLGSGAYTLRSNSLVQASSGSGSIPMMHQTGQDVVIRHREYIGDVSSSIAFSVNNTFPLNPGWAGTFPWLSTIAQQYQEYTFRGVVFEFVSTAGDAVSSTNNAMGSVIMATNYRATAPAFTNKSQMLNEFFSCDAKPCETFCHPIECDPLENPYNVQYVRGALVPSNEDPKTYDLGTMTLATQGMQAGSIDVGELWVTYEVELRKPVLTGLSNLFGSVAHMYTTTGVASAAPFGTGGRTMLSDNIGLSFSNTTLTFPKNIVGHYRVTVAWATCSAFGTGTFTLTNCTQVQTPQGTTSGIYSACTAGSAYSIQSGIYNITDPTVAASVAIGASTMTGVSQMDVWVEQVGYTDV